MKLFIPIIFWIFLILTILIGCVASEEIEETDPVACNNRGFTYIMEGQYEKAIAYLSHAIRLNPEYAVPYNNRGFAYAQKGQYDQAISDFTKAIEIDPIWSGAYYYNRGMCYYSKKKYGEAWDDVNMAQILNYEVDPDFFESLRIASGRQIDIESTRVNENKWEKECETYEECFFWCNTILSAVGKDGMNMLTVVEDKKLCICEARNW